MNATELPFNTTIDSEPDADVGDVIDEEPTPEEETHYLSQSILTMLAMVAINALSLNYLRKLRIKYPIISRYIQDTTVTTLIGVFAGLCLSSTHQTQILAMIRDGYQNFFMIILLPPIIFESAINMHKKSFLKNIGSILMYAVFGTLLASILTALGIYFVGCTRLIPEFQFTFGESFAFGSLISSTDPVSVLAIFKEMNTDRTLYSLVFGESILNDAIAIVLYNTISTITLEGEEYDGGIFYPILKFGLLLLGSICIGFIIGLICAVALKVYFNKAENNSIATSETTLMIVIPWAAYLIGESFNLSGVVTLLFCGISMTKYALPYLSPTGRKLTQSIYGTLSYTAENLVFIFIGIGFFSFEHSWSRLTWVILLLSFVIITGSRFVQISIITKITNLFRKQDKITHGHKMILTYSGFRGAMAFALATNAIDVFVRNDAGSMMLTLTLVYATMTIFVQGSFLVPVIEYFSDKRKFSESNSFDNLEEDPLELNSWDKLKGSFHKVEKYLARLLLQRKGEPLREGVFHDDEHSAVLSPTKGISVTVKTKELDFPNVKHRSKGEEHNGHHIKEDHHHNKDKPVVIKVEKDYDDEDSKMN